MRSDMGSNNQNNQNNAPDRVEYELGDDTVTVATDEAEVLREYTLTTTHELRDNLPPDKSVTFTERASDPILRSGNLLVDAVFAMAFHEAELASVESISDGAFNNGEGVECSCFETGEKWNYVWTRDTAYAVDLGLAWVDPSRARRSLEFKLSERKSGGGVEIVQDTGTGGSWPVSTDRVVWSIGARTLLNHLDGQERQDFAELAFEALKNTIETDRQYVYDSAEGLYRGEQSFLDWREQSYASWMAEDPAHIAMSRALSTNVGHLINLRLAADLAGEQGEDALADQYGQWAESLAEKIQQKFWLDDFGMWASITGSRPGAPALRKFDLLGISLAVLEGLGAPTDRQSAVGSYPHAKFGPPVLHPQQPLIPIYHNRGMWPFVTAYGLMAAREVENDAVFSRDFYSLVRGAALNLSHMENFEFQTQKNYVDDGDFSGPVVNSRRQLWSVAGFIGAVIEGLAGVRAREDRLEFEPFVTGELHERYFAETESIELHGLTWRDARFDVRLMLPESVGQGAYTVSTVTIDGEILGDSPKSPGDYDGKTIEIELAASEAIGNLTEYPEEADFRAYFAPREPTITSLAKTGSDLTLTYDSSGEDGVVFNIYRNGELVAERTSDTTWIEQNVDFAREAPCYEVESVFTEVDHHSHLSRPVCWRGENESNVQRISAYGLQNVGGMWATEHGRVHIGSWGQPDDQLVSIPFQVDWDGTYDVRVIYGNGSNGITTGITAATKWMSIAGDFEGVVEPVVMPQLGDWSRWGESTIVEAPLMAGQTYTLSLTDGQNMSYFDHFTPYTGGSGGGPDTFNAANIHAIELVPRGGLDQSSALALSLDGQNDFDKFAPQDQFTPGAPLDAWSRTAVAADSRYIYLVQVSRAFEEPVPAWNVYIGPPGISDGIEYSGQTPKLPIGARWLVSTRQQNSPEDPWNGIWERDPATGVYTRIARLEPQVDYWLSADQHTMSVRIPRALFEDTDNLWMVSHVVWAQPANEWKEVFPDGHTPWADGGAAHPLNLP